MAPGSTKGGSEKEAPCTIIAHTVLVSRESCQVGLGRLPLSGLGLRKWVMICRS